MTASSSERVSDSSLESDEEERFFSQPPEQPPEPEAEPASPVALDRSHFFERRARLQKRVALWLGLGSALILLAAVWRHRSDARVALPAAQAAEPVTGTLRAALPASVASPASVALPQIPSSAPLVVEPSTPVAAVAPMTTPSASAAPAASASSDDATRLLERASKQLSAGHTRDGVALARAAVAADPLDARAYVLLAAGLEDLGDWVGARAAFSDCRKQARRGPSSTCAYFARH